MAGIFGADLRRDDTGGPNTLTIYQRRSNNPIYVTCPECEKTNHLSDEYVEEVKEEGIVALVCPVCGHDPWEITEDDFEKRYYTRAASVDIGEKYE